MKEKPIWLCCLLLFASYAFAIFYLHGICGNAFATGTVVNSGSSRGVVGARSVGGGVSQNGRSSGVPGRPSVRGSVGSGNAVSNNQNKSKAREDVPNVANVSCVVQKVLGGSRVLLKIDFTRSVGRVLVFKEEDGSIVKVVIRSGDKNLEWRYNDSGCKDVLVLENFYYDSEHVFFVSMNKDKGLKVFYVGADDSVRRLRMVMGSDLLPVSDVEYELSSGLSDGQGDDGADMFGKMDLSNNLDSFVVGNIDKIENFFLDAFERKKRNYDGRSPKNSFEPKKAPWPVALDRPVVSLRKHCPKADILPVRKPFSSNVVTKNGPEKFDLEAILDRVVYTYFPNTPLEKPHFLKVDLADKDVVEVVEFVSGKAGGEGARDAHGRDFVVSPDSPQDISGVALKDGFLSVKKIVQHTVDHVSNTPEALRVKDGAENVIKFVTGSGGGREGGENLVIVLDPGHGGKDSGAVSKNGIKEKDVVMLFADILRQKLVQKGFKVVMTRKGDYYVMLHRRVMHARVHKPAFMISIHADGSANRSARGASAYSVSDECIAKEGKKVMDKKKPMYWDSYFYRYGDLVGNAIISIMQHSSQKKSVAFVKGLLRNLSHRRVNVHSIKEKYADFAVLKGIDVPSALIELGFLTNEQDAKMLLSRDYLNRFADTVVHTLLETVFE
jgi:N-acetylmuramoyl-L-alanine amidase